MWSKSYSASFAIPSNDSTVLDGYQTLSQMVSRTGSITFEEYWSDFSGLVGYYTGSLKIESPTRTGFNYISRQPDIKVTNIRDKYKISDIVRFRVFGVDYEEDTKRRKSSKTPMSVKSVIFDEVYYRIVDAQSGDEVIPFMRSNNGTRLSTDSEGQFFNFRMDNLFAGKSYTFEFLIVDRGLEFKVNDSRVKFKLEK